MGRSKERILSVFDTKTGVEKAETISVTNSYPYEVTQLKKVKAIRVGSILKIKTNNLF